jgi:hypothetical protein
MPNFIKKRLVSGVFLQLQRRGKRQNLSRGFVEYFCAAKPQSRDLNSVQWSEAERCLTALLKHYSI